MLKNFPKATPLPCPDSSLLYGVELEIENTQNNDWVVPGMEGKEDNSLRNNGWEYVTQPMTFSNLAYCLNLFFTKSKVTAANYSERCSIHVHTNCRDLTWEQVSTLCLLYQMLEPLFFAFVGEERDKNIFCVPWSETQLTYNVINRLKSQPNTLKEWQKYTALNLRTLWTYGTVEWRHMAGTHDMEKILHWCRLIGCLYAYVRKNNLEDTKKFVINLNTSSEYRKSIDVLFGEWAHLLYVKDYEVMLEAGVLSMKYALLNPQEAAEEPVDEHLPHLPEMLARQQAQLGELRGDAQDNEIRANNFVFANQRNWDEADVAPVMDWGRVEAAPQVAQQGVAAAPEVNFPAPRLEAQFRPDRFWRDMPVGFPRDFFQHEVRNHPTNRGVMQIRLRDAELIQAMRRPRPIPR
jgi:hypothetical protein